MPGNTITYTDNTITAKTAYWYRVSAVDATGSSFPSNEVRIVTPLSSPQITLTNPAPPTASLQSGSNNTIETTATDSGSSVASAEYQLVIDNPSGTFNAKDIYATQMNLSIPAALAGSPTSDTTAMPSGLPAGAIAEFEIRGTLSAVNAATGEWQIGTPSPFIVYESASTNFVGTRKPVAGDAVKVIAYRSIASGPLVAQEIRLVRPNQPAGAASLILSFLLNGTVTSIQSAVSAPGYLVSGETWSIGTGSFRIDDPDFPAYMDPAVGVGSAVSVRFAPPPAQANVARQIFQQIPAAIQTTTNVNTVFDNTPIPANIPSGAWLYVIVDGVVQNVDLVTGTWTVGTEQIKVYQTAQTLVGLGTVGDEVLFWGHRTLTPGPIVLDQLNQILPGPLAQPYKPTAIETHLMYNGKIQSMGPNTWNVGGHTFVVDDPEGPARIDPLPQAAFAVGSDVTVEFDHVGETLPDNTNWAPLTLNASTNKWTGTISLPNVNANQRRNALPAHYRCPAERLDQPLTALH